MENRLTGAGREKRGAHRFVCEGAVSISSLIGGTRVSGTMLDLSISGCLVSPDQPDLFRQDEVVEVSFCIREVAIRAKGWVRDIRPARESMGIEFAGLTDSARRDLLHLMQRLGEESLRSVR
jgi:PilZ domain